MRVLTIGLDASLCKENSDALNRIKQHAQRVDWYGVIVPTKKKYLYSEGNLEIIGTGGFIKPVQLVRLAWYAFRAVRAQTISVLSSQDVYFLGVVAILIGRFRRVGVEIQVHGLEKFTMLRKELADFTLRHADSIRVVSKDLKKHLHEYFGTPNHRMIVAPIFVDWQELRRRNFDHRIKAIAEKHMVFLVVGRMVEVKQFEQIIRAFSHIYSDFPNTHLLLVGDGPLKPHLMAEVREMGIEQAVEFVGWVEDVVPYYRGSDCGIFFSKSEGYGLALVEALACQLPVIATPVGVAREVIQDGVNGLLVKPDDFESLEQLMRLMVVNESMRKKMRNLTRSGLENLPTQEEVYINYDRSWQRCDRITRKNNQSFL